MIITPHTNGEIADGMPADIYDSTPGVRSTQLKRLLDATPAHAIAATDDAGINFGSDIHLAFLEPEQFAARYAIGPEERRNSKVWTQFVDANPGKECRKPSEAAKLMAAREAIWRHPYISRLLAGAQRELSVFADVPVPAEGVEDTVRIKARLDIYNPELGIIGDIKTCGDAGEWGFARQCRQLRYALQMHHYATAAQAVGLPVRAIVIIAVEEWKSNFFVRPFTFAPEAMDAAAAEWGEAVSQWYQCESANHWPAYPVNVATINPYLRRMP